MAYSVASGLLRGLIPDLLHGLLHDLLYDLYVAYYLAYCVAYTWPISPSGLQRGLCSTAWPNTQIIAWPTAWPTV